jgi:hypothetical protein
MRTKIEVVPGPCCRSGKCPECLEEARWDRVFQRNIDPGYYDRRQVLWPATLSPVYSSRTESMPGKAQKQRHVRNRG